MADQGVRYLSTTGSDSYNGLSDQTPMRTLAKALGSFPNPYGDVQFLPGYSGTFNTTIQRQGFRLLGTGGARGAATGGTTLTWVGGTGAMLTTSPDDNTDWTNGLIKGILFDGANKSGDGLYIRNPQNLARVEDVRVQGCQGIGVRVYGVGTNAGNFPGFVTLDRVWAWGGKYPFSIEGGYTDIHLSDCGVDSDSLTLAGFHIIDGAARGLDADILMSACKFEAHPSGVSGVLHEGHAGVKIDSMGVKFGSPNDAGIAFHSTLVPMRLNWCQSQGYGAFYTGPDGTQAANAHGGVVYRGDWPAPGSGGGGAPVAPHSHSVTGTTSTN